MPAGLLHEWRVIQWAGGSCWQQVQAGSLRMALARRSGARYKTARDAASASSSNPKPEIRAPGADAQEREKVRDRARRDAASASEERKEEKKKLKEDERKHKEDERRAKEEGDEARHAKKAQEKAARQARLQSKFLFTPFQST